MSIENPSPIPKQPYTWRKRAVVSMSLALGAAAILAACGGAGNDSVAPQTADDGKKSALAVPPAWKGRAPAPEYINGILVPPEPAPTINNSTLAGVDSNANGVRDDVERIIAQKWPASFPKGMAAAKYLQQTVVGPFPVDPLLTQSAFCVFVSKAVDEHTLSFAVLNTDARRQAYADNLTGKNIEECQ